MDLETCTTFFDILTITDKLGTGGAKPAGASLTLGF